MTAAEWLTSNEPVAMLRFLGGRASDRKLNLFACACCRSAVSGLFDMRAIRVAEDFADGRVKVSTLRNAWRAWVGSGLTPWVPASGTDAIGQAANCATYCASSRVRVEYPQGIPNGITTGHADRDEESRRQAGFLRDVFGHLFVESACAPSWLTSTVVALAHGIYAERAFDRLPILADALMDAGCSHEEVLSHCRSEGLHVRGCWVVDVLLGKG